MTNNELLLIDALEDAISCLESSEDYYVYKKEIIGYRILINKIEGAHNE